MTETIKRKPLEAIISILDIAERLTPVILPQLVAIAKSVEGISDSDTMSVAEYVKSIRETQDRARNRSWEDPIE